MKQRITLAILIFVFNWMSSFSQSGIEWQKCFGGTGFETGNSIKLTNDGGFIIVGDASSSDGDVSGIHGGRDFWVVKIDSTGNLQWQKCLGGTGDETANSIQLTNDGGFIIAGQTVSNDGDVTGNHGSQDIWIVKLSSSGNLQWQKCLGGTNVEYAYSIQLTSDAGYIVSGETFSNDGDVSGFRGYYDFWITKLDSLGNLEWQKCLGGTGADEYANSIQVTNDGGFIVAGRTSSNDGDVSGNHGTQDSWIVKLDSSGNLQWQKCFGGTGAEYANSIQLTNDGGYIIAGRTSSNNGDVSGNHGSGDYWIIKIDSIGNLEWQKCLGGTGNEVANYIQVTNDSGFIVAGRTTSNDGDVSGNHGSEDFWITKLNTTGNLQWQKCFGGTSLEYANSIEKLNDGSFIVAGRTESNNGDVIGNHGNRDIWVVKLPNCFAPISSSICLVTVDSATNRNKIVWEKPFTDCIDSFRVYKESTISGSYLQIGAVAAMDLSVFIDTASNPQQQADRYQINTVTPTGIEGNFSVAHKTIHLTISQGIGNTFNLTWDDYEGIPYGSFYILRGNSPGNLTTIDSVQSTLHSYTDLNPPAGNVYYAVEIRKPSGCNPTARFSSTSYASSRSNIKENISLEINAQESMVSSMFVIPNPAHEKTTLQFNIEKPSKMTIKLTDIIGRDVMDIIPVDAHKGINSISISTISLVNGTYFIELSEGSRRLTRKLMVDHR